MKPVWHHFQLTFIFVVIFVEQKQWEVQNTFIIFRVNIFENLKGL